MDHRAAGRSEMCREEDCAGAVSWMSLELVVTGDCVLSRVNGAVAASRGCVGGSVHVAKGFARENLRTSQTANSHQFAGALSGQSGRFRAPSLSYKLSLVVRQEAWENRYRSKGFRSFIDSDGL